MKMRDQSGSEDQEMPVNASATVPSVGNETIHAVPKQQQNLQSARKKMKKMTGIDQQKRVRRLKLLYAAFIFGIAVALLISWYHKNQRLIAEREQKDGTEDKKNDTRSFLDRLLGIPSASSSSSQAQTNNGVATQSRQASSQELTTLAKRLRDGGFVLYGFTQCGWTRRQRELFGERGSEARTILESIYQECRTSDSCPSSVRVFPTWSNGEENFPGYRDAGRLQKLLYEHAAPAKELKEPVRTAPVQQAAAKPVAPSPSLHESDLDGIDLSGLPPIVQMMLMQNKSKLKKKNNQKPQSGKELAPSSSIEEVLSDNDEEAEDDEDGSQAIDNLDYFRYDRNQASDESDDTEDETESEAGSEHGGVPAFDKKLTKTSDAPPPSSPALSSKKAYEAAIKAKKAPVAPPAKRTRAKTKAATRANAARKAAATRKANAEAQKRSVTLDDTKSTKKAAEKDGEQTNANEESSATADNTAKVDEKPETVGEPVLIESVDDKENARGVAVHQPLNIPVMPGAGSMDLAGDMSHSEVVQAQGDVLTATGGLKQSPSRAMMEQHNKVMSQVGQHTKVSAASDSGLSDKRL